MTFERFVRPSNVFLCFFGVVLFALAVTARQRATPVYDPATVVTVSGTVETVEQHQCSLGWDGYPARASWLGTHVILRTDYGVLDAHLGPALFLKQHWCCSTVSTVPDTVTTVAGSRCLAVRLRQRAQLPKKHRKAFEGFANRSNVTCSCPFFHQKSFRQIWSATRLRRELCSERPSFWTPSGCCLSARSRWMKRSIRSRKS